MPQFPDAVVQASLDSYLGTVVIQAFVSGMILGCSIALLPPNAIRLQEYTRSFCSAQSARQPYQVLPVPSLRNGRHIVLMIALVVLYALTMINFAVTWAVVRSIFITNNATRQTMATKMFVNSINTLQIGNGAGVISILIADSLLVWRCYMLWLKNKWLLALFGIPLLAEVALIPVLLALNLSIGPKHIPVICIFFFISMGITIFATSMIIIRILTVSRAGGTAGRYRYVIEILVESGILYSTLLFITGVLQALTTAPLPVTEAATYFTAVLIPVTGIAPTLISERIMTSTERDEEKWSQPVSFLKFKHTAKTNGTGTTMAGLDSLPFTMKTAGTNSADEENASVKVDEMHYAPDSPQDSEKRL
ncbi:hypothetical protein BDQ17DRAFT_1333606 [Cyathus striatus]|nr:hypothetical protein BDQ17DRAFT_1333606 [Cyathus striatus]